MRTIELLAEIFAKLVCDDLGLTDESLGTEIIKSMLKRDIKIIMIGHSLSKEDSFIISYNDDMFDVYKNYIDNMNILRTEYKIDISNKTVSIEKKIKL